MTVYDSKLNSSASIYTDNRQDMLRLIEQCESFKSRALQKSELRR